jgi:hypothetical protein
MSFPDEAASRDSLQAIATPHTFEIVDHPAHGVGACYLDANGVVALSFEDGEGHIWHGTADVFALFYEQAGSLAVSAGGIAVTVTPYNVTVALSGTQQFVASISGSSDLAVIWSVDDIEGGNGDIGTIDATGLYTAPAVSGTHVVKAVSHANGAAYGTQLVTVGTGSGSSGTSSSSVVVSPASVSLTLGGTYTFVAAVSGASDPTVEWLVNGVVGGSAVNGTVDAGGMYTAPDSIGSFVVSARLVSNPAVIGSARVYVGSLPIGGSPISGGGGEGGTVSQLMS